MADNTDLVIVAYYLIGAGLAAGVAAAGVGMVDYLFTVPPASSAKRRATWHAVANASALLLFAGAWVLRGGPGVEPEPVLLGLEGVGTLLLAAGGWMGGTLSFRNQIGVDHRYAHAGKWKEQAFPADSKGFVTVARTDDLEVDQMKLLRFGRARLVLARSEAGWTAFDDRCPHKGGSLAGGVMACGRVICPWHGSQFDTASGVATAGPATESIRVCPTEIRGSEVRVDPTAV